MRRAPRPPRPRLAQSHNGADQGGRGGGERGIGGGARRWPAHFRAATPALIAAWRAAIAADPQLTASNALPRVQLEDHLPQWLESFAGVLAALPGEPVADAAEARDAEAHGLQRWQQGYDLHDVTREWGCLHRCLVAELERFTAAHPELPAEVFAEARMKLAEQVSEAMSTSAERYFRLERVEAAGSVRDLERALAEVRELETQRAELWQQAAHDLRGNLGVVSNVAQGLAFADLPADRRDDFLAPPAATTSPRCSHLLDDVTALARLQAGQEERRVAPFDAADLLRRLCDDVRRSPTRRAVARRPTDRRRSRSRAMRSRCAGSPRTCSSTRSSTPARGGVSLRWGEAAPGDARRWRLSVAGQRPGLSCRAGRADRQALNPSAAANRSTRRPTATSPSPATRRAADQPGAGRRPGPGDRQAPLRSARRHRRLEFETVAEKGTTVRVLLPRRYAARHG